MHIVKSIQNTRIDLIVPFFVLVFFIFSCSTKNNTIPLKRILPETKNEKDRFIRIKLNNFQNFKTEITLTLQEYKSFQSENYKFEPQYTFSESTKDEFVDIQLPKGEYVGSLEIRATHLIPYYRKTTGYHSMYFGVNGNYTTFEASDFDCKFRKSYRSIGNPNYYSINHCKNLELSYNNKTFEFSLSETNQMNPERTLYGLFISLSLGRSASFVFYPYAPFLVIQGFFGLTQNEIFINFDRYGIL